MVQKKFNADTETLETSLEFFRESVYDIPGDWEDILVVITWIVHIVSGRLCFNVLRVIFQLVRIN